MNLKLKVIIAISVFTIGGSCSFAAGLPENPQNTIANSAMSYVSVAMYRLSAYIMRIPGLGSHPYIDDLLLNPNPNPNKEIFKLFLITGGY